MSSRSPLPSLRLSSFSSSAASRLPRAVALAAAVGASAVGATGPHSDVPSGAERLAPDAAVVAIVEVPRPWYAPRFVITGKMRDTMPQYAALPGLAFKAYSYARADGAFGGVYLWTDAASVRAWFSPAWFERVRRERGVEPRVRLMQVVGAIDTSADGTPAQDRGDAVATLLRSAADPASAATIDDLLAADRQVPGLLRRYRVIDDAGRPAVLSLWRDDAAARARLDAGAQSAAEWFDTPILLPGTRAVDPARRPAR